MKRKASADVIGIHIAKHSEGHQIPLKRIRALLKEILPDAEETIKYGMPCFAVGGKGVAAFDSFKNHWSYFPMSGSVLGKVDELPSWTEEAKGTLRIPLDKMLTKQLVRQLVRIRLDEINKVSSDKR